MSAVKPQRTVAGQKGQVWDILYLPDGRRTITCSEDGSLRVWDLESGKQEGENWEDKDSGTMWAIALSPGGKEVASGSDDGIVRLWDIETGKVTARWTGHGSEVASICWSPDGGQVVSGSSDGTARMWNVESGETILEPIKTGHMCVRTVHYSPDATMIATGGNNSNGESSVKLWDVETGELLKTLRANMLGEVLCLAWSLDVNTLISGSLNYHNDSIRKFDTATGTQTAVLEGHRHLVKALSLSPNNRILASASSDKTTRLWNIETNQPIGPPLLHEDAVRSASFSPDGKLLATVCDDHQICTWDVAAIVREAGFGKLLTASPPKVGRKLISETNTTQRRSQKITGAHRLPPGFFNDSHVGPSTTPPRHGRGSRTTPSSSRTLLGRLSSFFPRFHHTTSSVVEVPTVQDRKALYVSPPRQKKQLLQGTYTQGQQQQQGQSHGQASSSHPPVTSATATSTTSAAAGATPASTTATPSRPATANNLSLWTRIVLCICCVSVDYTNGPN